MKNKIRIVAFLLSTLHTLHAQVWQQTNGPTAQVAYATQAITAVGTTLFRGTSANGVLKSIDNASNWSSANTGITNLNIKAMCTIDTTILAGSSGGGVFISTNNGANWSASNTGLINLSIRSLLVNGTNIFAATAGGVFLSINHGASWTAVNTGLTTLNVNNLIFKGVNLFAATQGGGVFLSADNGTTWNPVNTGITNLNIASLGSNSYYIFAGTGSGIATLFSSADNGTTWSVVYTGTVTANIITIVTRTGFSWVYIGCSSAIGLLFSSNNGAGCAPANSGIGGTPSIQHIYALYSIGSTVYAGSSAGFFIVQGMPASYNSWYGGNGNNVMQGSSSLTFGSTTTFGMLTGSPAVNGINVSHNQGTSWYNVYKQVYPNPNSLLAYNNAIFSGQSNGVKMSTDGGGTWNYINTGLGSTYVNCLFENSGNIYAATSSGVYYFNWSGYTWTVMNTGLTNLNVTGMQKEYSTLYCVAGMNGECLINTSSTGGTWVHQGYVGDQASCFLNNYYYNSHFIVGTYSTGIYYSNYGTTWTHSPSSGNTQINALTQASGNVIVLAATNTGVLISYDHGVTWTNFSTGLTGGGLQVNSIVAYGSTIFAATDAGVWKIDLSAAPPTVTTSACTGSTVTLTCSPASTYYWSTGATTQSITISTSGSYSVTATNAYGFSASPVSTIVTLAPLPVASVTALGATTFCDDDSVTLSAPSGGASYYSYLWSNGAITQNTTVSASGNYSVTTYNVNGCSATSTPVTVTELPTNNPAPINQSACDTYIWNGQTLTTSGVYTQLFTDASGCDSTATINLSIQSNAEAISPNACNSYTLNGQTFTSSGTYYQVLSNMFGCDSTVTINLTINAAMDTTVTQSGNVFTANESGATYQWLDCISSYTPIASEINQTFIANTNGNYAVLISTATCGTDTSACYSIFSVGINQNKSSDDFAVYPNPANDHLSLTLSSGEGRFGVKIYNVLGECMVHHQLTTNNQPLTIDVNTLATGLYFVEVATDTGIMRKKFVKQ